MNTPRQIFSHAGEAQAPQRKPTIWHRFKDWARAQRAWAHIALGLAAAGCGAAQPAQTPYTETSGHAEMTVVQGESQSLVPVRERYADLLENPDRYRVYPRDEEGNFGSLRGGWSFRIVESESSERAEMYTYEIFSHRLLFQNSSSEPVTKIVTVRSINPYMNIPLENSDYTPSVESDVFILAIPEFVVFRFFSPQEGVFTARVAELREFGIPRESLSGASYDAVSKNITVFFLWDDTLVLVTFDLLTTNTSARLAQ